MKSKSLCSLFISFAAFPLSSCSEDLASERDPRGNSDSQVVAITFLGDELPKDMRGTVQEKLNQYFFKHDGVVYRVYQTMLDLYVEEVRGIDLAASVEEIEVSSADKLNGIEEKFSLELNPKESSEMIIRSRKWLDSEANTWSGWSEWKVDRSFFIMIYLERKDEEINVSTNVGPVRTITADYEGIIQKAIEGTEGTTKPDTPLDPLIETKTQKSEAPVSSQSSKPAPVRPVQPLQPVPVRPVE